jgi:hypothetical protein
LDERRQRRLVIDGAVADDTIIVGIVQAFHIESTLCSAEIARNAECL